MATGSEAQRKPFVLFIKNPVHEADKMNGDAIVAHVYNEAPPFFRNWIEVKDFRAEASRQEWPTEVQYTPQLYDNYQHKFYVAGTETINALLLLAHKARIYIDMRPTNYVTWKDAKVPRQFTQPPPNGGSGAAQTMQSAQRQSSHVGEGGLLQMEQPVASDRRENHQPSVVPEEELSAKDRAVFGVESNTCFDMEGEAVNSQMRLSSVDHFQKLIDDDSPEGHEGASTVDRGERPADGRAALGEVERIGPDDIEKIQAIRQEQDKRIAYALEQRRQKGQQTITAEKAADAYKTGPGGGNIMEQRQKQNEKFRSMVPQHRADWIQPDKEQAPDVS